MAGVYELDFGRHLHSATLRGLASDWTINTVMQFASGRPYAALLAPTDGGDILNNTAALQSTANSALGINGAGPSPFAGLNSFYGSWTQQIDVGLARRFHITERQSLSLQAQAFNLLNHANYYVANGNGVFATQFVPIGDGCGKSGEVCGLVPNADFGRLQRINALNGPRVLQFSLKYSF